MYPKTFTLYHKLSTHLSSKPIKQILLEYQDLCAQGHDESEIDICSDITGEIVNDYTFYVDNHPYSLSQVCDLLPYFDKFTSLTIPAVECKNINYLEV